MQRAKSKNITRQALFLIASAVYGSVGAQSYPVKPVRMIVPFPAGGGADVVGRIVAHKLGDRLGQQIIVDNRPGAGGSLGTEAAVRSTPDGYTMVVASTSQIAINPSLYKNLKYDTVKDLTPLAILGSTPVVVVIHPSLRVGSARDLIALAKARPNDLNVASAGNGTITHLAGELFRYMAKVKWTHVPYKGAPQAVTDLASGQVQVMFAALPAAMSLIKANRVKAIAVSTTSRESSLPQVPTVAESGLPGYEVAFWYGAFLPAATPKEVVNRLADAIAQTLKLPEVVSSLAGQGAAPGRLSQPQMIDFIQAEVAKWSKAVEASGATID